MYFLIDFVRETARVFYTMAPFLLFGFFLAGLLHVLIPRRWLQSALGAPSFRSVALASLAGVPLPLCSCSVLPAAAAMRKGGASKGATASFVTSTPQTGIDSISLTYAMMDPIMTFARPFAALATALVAGSAVNAVDSPRRPATPLPPLPDGAPEATDPLPSRPGDWRNRLRSIFTYAYGELLDDIVSWMLLGLLLTGLIGALVPSGALQNPNLQGFSAMLAMLVIGIPLYVCAVSSTPLAAMLILKGLSPGIVMVFLLAGPATNATSIAVLLKLLGRRAVVLYLLAIATLSILAGLVVDAVYTTAGVDAMAVAGSAGELMPVWLQLPSALLLMTLLVASATRTAMLSTWRRRLARIGPPLGVNLGGRAAGATALVGVILLYLLSGCSVLGPGETGWVMSFGKVVRDVEQPGLVLHWPYPFARLEKVQYHQTRSLTRGFRREGDPAVDPVPAPSPALRRELTKEAEVATGDENLLAIQYTVQYHVADPFRFRFALDDPAALVGSFAEYALRRVMCAQETDSVLVNHWRALELEVTACLQAGLDRVEAGVAILRVDLRGIHAPQQVHAAFRDVASALEDNHRFVRQSESYRNRVVAAARAQSCSETSRAAGDRVLLLAEAGGRAAGFASLAAASRDSRDITRRRMQLDALAAALRPARVIVPLSGLPLDLWCAPRGGLPRTWDPWNVPPPSGDAPAGKTGGVTGGPQGGQRESPGETWRDKLERLQEEQRWEGF